jgi:hypothetical protein
MQDLDSLMTVLGDAPVQSFADLGGEALPLTLAMWTRWHCRITLIDLQPDGTWPIGNSPWVKGYRAALSQAGVPDDQVTVVVRKSKLTPQDVVANLAGFGDAHGAAHLATFLPFMLQEGSRFITDVRKGSGTYAILKPMGVCTGLSRHYAGGKPVARTLLQIPVLAVPADVPAEGHAAWRAIAAELAGDTGFYRESGDHSFLFVPRSDTLVVTFDNLDIAMEKREDRRPWGFSFIEKQGWSMLGVMAQGWTWYRDAWVSQQFDDLRDSGFFTQFKRVVFYGASMGGYAACAFVAACPGADVVAISPQSTLARRLVPWETRYGAARGRDFTGPYGDAAAVSAAAGRVTILYDPYEVLDTAHVARFTHDNVMKLRTPLMGHRLGSSLHQMGVLSQITLGALNGTLTELEFYRVLRARKTFQRYQRELFKRALARGRPGLARKLGQWVLTQGDNRYIRKGMIGL